MHARELMRKCAWLKRRSSKLEALVEAEAEAEALALALAFVSGACADVDDAPLSTAPADGAAVEAQAVAVPEA